MSHVEKLEIWRELGRRHGMPKEGSPEYARKKNIYHTVLLEEEARINAEMSQPQTRPDYLDELPLDESPPCCCDCHLRSHVAPPVPYKKYQRSNTRPVYIESDSESEVEERKRIPPPRVKSTRKQVYISSSESESEEEERPIKSKTKTKPDPVNIKKKDKKTVKPPPRSNTSKKH